MRHQMMFCRYLVLGLFILLAGCTLSVDDAADDGGEVVGELYTVTRVIDGDTIDVVQGDVGYRVRYLNINTPERDEPCYSEARVANASLVDGQQVRLVADETNTDRYGRLLRYIYVGDTLVNEVLVREGWAEAVLYPPDDRHYERFLEFEKQAASAGLGCHPTGIFDDGTDTR